MKVVLLADDTGTRLSKETEYNPKPIIWHVMKTYSYYGFNDFIILPNTAICTAGRPLMRLVNGYLPRSTATQNTSVSTP